MDLESIWQQNSGGDEELNRLLEKGNFNQLPSRLPLKKLKNNLILGIILASGLTLGYIVLIFFITIWQVSLALGVMIVFNTLIMLDSWKLYQKTPSTIMPSNSLKEELTLHYASFRRWWSVQEKMGLFVYPIAVAGGFILGGASGSGEPVESFLYNGKMLAFLGITVLILVPICYFSARWMFHYAYGKHLKKLKAAIDELS